MHWRLDAGVDMLMVGSRTRGKDEARWERVGRAARRKVVKHEKIIVRRWRSLGTVAGSRVRALCVWSQSEVHPCSEVSPFPTKLVGMGSISISYPSLYDEGEGKGVRINARSNTRRSREGIWRL